MPHFTRQFWTDCYSVSGEFGQSCTILENGCCSAIMPMHKCEACAPIPGSEDSSCAWSPSLLPWSVLRTCSCFPAWRRPSKVHVLRSWMPSKIVWQPICDRFHRKPSWLFPEAVPTLSKVCYNGWRLFWKAIKKFFVSIVLFAFLIDALNFLDTPCMIKAPITPSFKFMGPFN